MSSPNRLERALDLYAKHQLEGGDWPTLLAQHPDLTDLLLSFVEDPAVAAAASAECLGGFQLGREVGSGGVGTVYEARQQSLNRRVALKVMHAAFALNPRALARFRRESQILARLDHPGIVRVFATGEDRGQHWLAMEFVEGQTLAAHLDRLRLDGGHRGQSLRQVVEMIRNVADALQHAHAHEVIHRDVKPANILLRPDGTAVLGDFGIARDTEAPSLTQTGVVSGTPYYMAPEQIVGHAAACDARTDVWALGATLYECLTLRRAFDGVTSQEVMQAVLTHEPIDPRRLQPGLPIDLAAITQMAIEKDPAARYSTAQAFADDLRAFLELRPVTARPPSRTKRLLRLARRRPVLGLLLLLLLVTGALGTALLVQLPTMRAAAAAAAEAEFAAEFDAGLLACVNDDAETCLGHFRRALEIQAGSEEAVIGLCIGLVKFDGRKAALSELERRAVVRAASPQLDHCRSLLQARQRVDGAVAGAPQSRPGATWMECWLEAILIHGATEPAVTDRVVAPAATAQLAAAVSLLARAIRLAPRPCLSLHLHWTSLLSLIKVDTRHREAADAIVELWPNSAEALHYAGLLYLRIEPQRALDLLQRAQQLGAQDPVALVNLGIAQQNLGHRAEAVATFAAVLPHPRLPDAKRAFVVDAMVRMDDSEVGASLCEDWLRRSPGSFFARRCTAIYCVLNDDNARAIELLRSCVAMQPQNFVIQWELAQAQLAGNESQAAGQTLDRLAAQQPERARQDRSVHAMRLDIHRAQQDDAAALAELRRWAAVRDNDAVAWHALAVALLRADDPTAGESALAAAERADYLAGGTSAEYQALRAQCLDRLGRADEAARLRTRSLQSKPAK